MRIVAAVSVMFVFAAAGAFAQDAKSIERGQKVYADTKCATCHSIGGKGAAKGPLDGVGSKLTADEIRQWLVNPAEMTAKTKATRKPPMPSYAKKLPKEDLDALVAYLASLKK
jgi:mono/diheme cytochrome c family protein